MATEIIVALIGCAGSAAGAFCGILVNTKLTTYRLEQLEKKVDKHNTVIERTFKLEEAQAVMQEQIKVANHRIGDIYKDEENIKAILAEHMISPVKFSKCLETMLKMGIDTFVEIGPGKTLSGFVKRIKTEKEIKIYNICDVKSLENTLKEIN